MRKRRSNHDNPIVISDSDDDDKPLSTGLKTNAWTPESATQGSPSVAALQYLRRSLDGTSGAAPGQNEAAKNIGRDAAAKIRSPAGAARKSAGGSVRRSIASNANGEVVAVRHAASIKQDALRSQAPNVEEARSRPSTNNPLRRKKPPEQDRPARPSWLSQVMGVKGSGGVVSETQSGPDISKRQINAARLDPPADHLLRRTTRSPVEASDQVQAPLPQSDHDSGQGSFADGGPTVSEDEDSSSPPVERKLRRVLVARKDVAGPTSVHGDQAAVTNGHSHDHGATSPPSRRPTPSSLQHKAVTGLSKPEAKPRLASKSAADARSKHMRIKPTTPARPSAAIPAESIRDRADNVRRQRQEDLGSGYETSLHDHSLVNRPAKRSIGGTVRKNQIDRSSLSRSTRDTRQNRDEAQVVKKLSLEAETNQMEDGHWIQHTVSKQGAGVPADQEASAQRDTTRAGVAALQTEMLPARARTEDETEVYSTSDAVEAKLAEVQSLLKEHLRSYNAAHEKYVKLRLPAMRKRVDTTAEIIAGLQDDEDPFRHIQIDPVTNDSKSTRPASFTLQTSYAKAGDVAKNGKPARIALTTYKCEVAPLPEYEWCQRAVTNELARNHRVLPTQPRFACDFDDDEEKEFDDEAQELFVDGIHGVFPSLNGRDQYIDRLQQCRQLYPTIGRFLQAAGCSLHDILRVLLDDGLDITIGDLMIRQLQNLRQSAFNNQGNVGRPVTDWEPLLDNIDNATGQSVRNAIIACSAFHRELGFSIWPIAEQKARELAAQNPKIDDTLDGMAKHFCLVCYKFCCRQHGEYLEEDSDDTSGESDPDEEELDNTLTDLDPLSINNRRTVCYRPRSAHGEESSPLSTRRKRAGMSNTPLNNEGTEAKLKASIAKSQGGDIRRCSETCAQNRDAMAAAPFTDVEETLRRFSQEEIEEAKCLIEALGVGGRSSCRIATVLRKPCTHVFHLISILQDMYPRLTANRDPKQNHVPPKNRRDISQWTGVDRYGRPKSKTNITHERRPFMPCSHHGDCASARCICWRHKIHCEKTCNCSRACERRFAGCSCARVGKICRQSADCPCWLLARECDADLCGRCGADEVLDPMNRADDNIVKGRCANVSIQRGKPPRLLLGRSQVSGFGLYVGERIKKDEYLGEYRGEVLSAKEWDRRGHLYQHTKRQYTFRLNNIQEIDGAHLANKLRYINNSSNPKTTNCTADNRLCNTVSRVALYATRNLVPGEELFFNYDYPAAMTEGFIEPKIAPIVPVKEKVAKAGKKPTAARRKLKGILEPRSNLSKVFAPSPLAMSETGSASQEPDEEEPDDVDGDALLADLLEKQGNESDDADYEDTDDERPRTRTRTDDHTPRKSTRARSTQSGTPASAGATELTPTRGRAAALRRGMDGGSESSLESRSRSRDMSDEQRTRVKRKRAADV